MFYQNVSELLMVNVRRYPRKTAVIHRDVRLSYEEFNRQINRMAHMLLDMGVKAGHKVAYMFPNSIMLLAAYYAVQKIGGVAVPLNFRLVPRELQYLLEASDASVLLFDAQFLAHVEEISGAFGDRVSFLCSEVSDAWGPSIRERMEGQPEGEPALFADGEALSRIQFTGGSTGLPKGAMRTHSADICEAMGVMNSNMMGSDPDHVVLIQCPLEHHGGHSWYLSAFASGATLVICDVFDPETILGLIEKERVTYLMLLPPSTYLRLLDCPGLGEFDLSGVRLVQSAAGCTTPEIVEKIYAAFPNCVMNYGWGQTESGLGTSLVLTRQMAKENLSRIKCVGRPMPFLEAIVADEDGKELPPGRIGECLVKSPAVMKGYYRQPELTKKAFGDDGWLRTGDLMWKDEDGYLYLMSRKKDMIKSGGENVFAQEVEGVIKRHPAVLECVVFGVPERAMGEAVMAVVSLRPGHTLTLKEVQDHCRQYISSYKKPRYLDFIDEFDMDDAGKIRKSRVAERYRLKLRNEKRRAKGLLPVGGGSHCMEEE